MNRITLPAQNLLKKFTKPSGFSLVEVMVVLSLMGITAGLATVYMSSSETDLRKQVMNLRFDIEKAKQEAINRKKNIRLEFGVYDCNGDGTVDSDDSCYVILCEKCNDDRYEDFAYLESTYDVIKKVDIDSGFLFTQDDTIGFSPFGDSRLVTTNVESFAQTSPTDSCNTGCLSTAYTFSISQTGSIQVGDKVQSCVAETNCND